jgi:predicted dehydrogenase
MSTSTPAVGFIGTGFISRTHSWFLKHSTAPHRITLVSDLDDDRARVFADRVGATVATGPDQVLDEVDIVVIATWTSEHEHLVDAAATRGVAVFCEKPLATDATAAGRMVDAVERAGVVNQVGLVLRFMPQIVHARQLLFDPRAGRLMAVSFRDDQFIPIQSYYGSTWRIDPDRCGRGTLLEHSIHDVDVLQWLGGPVASVDGLVREMHGYDRIDDVAVAHLGYERSGVATLTSIWHDMIDRPSQRHVEIFCENLFVAFDGTPDGPLRWQFAGEPERTSAGVELAERCVAAGAMRAGDIVTTPGGGAMFNPLNGFVEAVVGGTSSPLPMREAMAAHRLVDAIYAAADARR